MMTNLQIIDAAEQFYTRVSSTCQALHKAYNDDIDFGLVGNQWDTTTTTDRTTAKRLTLTVNRLRQFIYQVVNDYKKSEMTSKVLPHDTSEKDKKLAEVRRGIMRSIERKKGGLDAYGNACKTLVAGGLGGWQINTRYCDPMSFDQEPYFIPIEDMSAVFVDFDDCRELDFSDMRECLVQETFNDKVRFKAETGVDANTLIGGNRINGVWGTKNGPTVSNYWFKEEDPETLCMLSPIAAQLIPGLKKTAYRSDLKKKAKAAGIEDISLLIAVDPKTGEPIQRETTRGKVRCAKIAAKTVVGDVLEWPIDLIPVVIVTGRKTVNNGKIVIESLIRPSKDAQRSYNYLKSNKTERIAQVPKNPIFVPEGSVTANEKKKWDTMNTRLWPYLTYAAYDSKQRPIAPPHRNDPIQSDPGLVEEERAAVDEIKSTLGMYDASIGNRSNETSGVAIRNRAQEADTVNYDFTESMVRGIKYSTKVLNKLIPKVIDTPRQIAMVGEDDKETVIMVNQPNPDGSVYNMDEGEFDVDYEAGPSSATKGQDIRDNLTNIFQAVPGTVLPLGSEYIRNSEMRNADQAAERFERWANTQSPGLYEDKKQGQPNPQMIAQMQAALQQMQQQMQEVGPQIQQLQAENHRLKVDSDNKAAQLEIDRFSADTERKKVDAEIAIKNGNMLLAADKQDHSKTIESAKAVHDIQRDNIDTAHEQRMDHQDFALAGAKAAADLSLKASAQADKAAQAKAKTDTPKTSGDKPTKA